MKDDKRNGYGTFTFGKKVQFFMYEGYFVNSKFEGLGKLVWKDGRVFEGQFKNGVPVQ